MSTASESCESIGQMSLFGETCERSRVGRFSALYPTPQADSGGSNPGKRDQVGLDFIVEKEPFRVSISSPQATPASHSHSPGSDWARRMTATYGRKLSAYWLSCDPPDSWVKTLLGTSTWGSTTCYLTWKKSVTPHGRLLFRLVPSTPRTAGIGSGLWGTPTSRDHKDTGSMENVPVNGLLGRQDLTPELYPTALAQSPATGHRQSWTRLAEAGQITHEEAHRARIGALNSAWVSRMMGYPDGWLDLTRDGEATR